MAGDTIRLDQLPAWAAAQVRMAAGGNLGKLLKVIRLLVIADTKQNFAKEADPVTGKQWPPLKPSTIRKRRKGSSLPLRDTGIMMASVSSPGAQWNIDQITAHGLTWGSSLPRADVHNQGGTWNLVSKKGKKYTLTIPQRRFIGVGPTLTAKIEKAVVDFVAGVIG